MNVLEIVLPQKMQQINVLYFFLFKFIFYTQKLVFFQKSMICLSLLEVYILQFMLQNAV